MTTAMRTTSLTALRRAARAGATPGRRVQLLRLVHPLSVLLLLHLGLVILRQVYLRLQVQPQNRLHLRPSPLPVLVPYRRQAPLLLRVMHPSWCWTSTMMMMTMTAMVPVLAKPQLHGLPAAKLSVLALVQVSALVQAPALEGQEARAPQQRLPLVQQLQLRLRSDTMHMTPAWRWR